MRCSPSVSSSRSSPGSLFVVTLVRFPQFDGDSIKATYMLFLGPLFVVVGLLRGRLCGAVGAGSASRPSPGPSSTLHGCRQLATAFGGTGERRRERRWWIVLGAVVAVRLAIPLVTLAFSGHALPGLPAYRYRPLNGDSYGFYSATREFIASIGRVGKPLLFLALVAVVAAFVLAVRLWRRGTPSRRVAAVLLPSAVVSLALTLPINQMEPPGAAVFGWPLLWAIPMIPIRAAGLGPSPDTAFVVGLVLTLAALAVAVVATAYVGRYATRRRSIGLVAAGLFAAWPLVSGQIVSTAWRNGQWNVDVGLHLYTEPLSTALVVTSVALVLRPATQQLGHAGAGLAIGYSTAVKLTNGLVGAVLAGLVLWRHGWKQAVPYAAGALVAAPIVLAYWPKGYVGMFDGATSASPHPWSPSYIDDAWRHSLLYTPLLLALLAPLLVVGGFAVRDRWALAVVATPIVVNAAVYSFYNVTALHPRFLYVTLPFVFVLEAAGALAVVDAVRRRREGVRVL